MTTSTTPKQSKKDLSILFEWFKSLVTYSATRKELCSRKICGSFMSDSRAWMTSSTTPEELDSRKNCGFFLSDSQASLLLQLLPKNCVQERFLGSSWVIQELHYFFNYSKRRIVFKNPAISLRGHHQLLLVTWRQHTQAQFTTDKIPFYMELSPNQSVRLIIEPEKNKTPQQQITAITLCRGKANSIPMRCKASNTSRQERTNLCSCSHSVAYKLLPHLLGCCIHWRRCCNLLLCLVSFSRRTLAYIVAVIPRRTHRKSNWHRRSPQRPQMLYSFNP
jgi:hypothetical protein